MDSFTLACNEAGFAALLSVGACLVFAVFALVIGPAGPRRGNQGEAGEVVRRPSV